MASETEKKRTTKRAAKGTTPQGAAAKGRAAGKRGGDKVSNGQAIAIPDEIELNVSFKTYAAGAYDHEELGLKPEDVLDMYRNMLLQRRFEERAAQMYGKQKIAGFLHLYIGQEAISTASAYAVRIGEDSIITAYRDHGIALALGMSPNAGMAELYGKVDGCSRGKGGSMHFFDVERRMWGGHGIVGAHIPIAVGLGFANKYKGEDTVCICYFGDGAIHQGAFHEAANLAGLYDLPVIFVIENNQYAMGTAVERAAAEPDLFKQAVAYDMPGALVNGMDVFTVLKALRDHIEIAREGTPSLVEIRTYRYRGHSMSDPGKYRTKEELEGRKNEDPIVRLKAYLIERKMADNDRLDAIDEEVKQVVLDAVEFAENSPFPPEEAIYEHVYTQEDYPFLA